MPVLLLALFLKLGFFGRGGSVHSWVDWHRKTQSKFMAEWEMKSKCNQMSKVSE